MLISPTKKNNKVTLTDDAMSSYIVSDISLLPLRF